MDFRNQIEEDIRFYQERHPNIEHIKDDNWAFNFWILDKLFCEDEDEIENKIVDYSDNGIDCFVWHEEDKDLFLIQNKYYDPASTSSLDVAYFNTAIEDGYSQLLNGTYSRSPELQAIFTKYRVDPDFYVYHYFYVTNNKRSEKVVSAVNAFNSRNSEKHRRAEVFYLDDIKEAYYGKPNVETKTLTVDLFTLNKGTTLNVNNEAYELSLPIDAIYIMLPVHTLYEALKKAERESYPIFDANIREYLGSTKSVNKGICRTLESEEDRKRFFFYNNGITVICDEAKSQTQAHGRYNCQITLKNPQIVNGCQTVSSIKHVLSSFPDSDLEEAFRDTFVMAKVLVIPKKTGSESEMESLRKSIVRYNNSQNNIDEKTFTATEDFFKTLQREFEKYGFLLLLKQSDKETFKNQYKKPTTLLDLAEKKLIQFGLKGSLKKTSDFFIPLDKLLQVVLAFAGDAQQAFQKKGNLLKKQTPQYQLVTEAIMSPEFKTQTLLNLYLLYLKSEQAKKGDKKIPITWYLIESFSTFECQGGNFELIDENLSTPEKVESLVELYKKATNSYLRRYKNQTGNDYNTMIKEKLDIKQMENERSVYLDD